MVFPAGHRRVSAHDPTDRYIGEDYQPPNYHAHRRWFMTVVVVFALAILAALICGALRSVSDITPVLADPSLLTEPVARAKFFAALLRVAAPVLVFGIVVILLRRRRRRKASRPRD
ncbi:hypothetical protein [Rhizomicrobium electricum]|uniref:Uncharacterized protein n=1 Tax=Rhizomicrobium electricum TaxID=480070 RepID=A0ABN1E4Y5_9PROT|nr:hypothetical protein [Rhizomicrobium electricum]NIJ47669.1 beta-lactamase regulating signal transducer with metallopeptidase domain [Rhizomicrobium electricum]